MKKCERNSSICKGNDLRLCQMKSASNPKNVYKGRIILMCQECRQMERGQYKFVKDDKQL